MLEHSVEAITLCANRERADLDRDRLLNLSIVRLLEIIGEAANRISLPTQQAHPEIPWLQIVELGLTMRPFRTR